MKKTITALAALAVMTPAVVSAAAIDDARDANICDVTRAEYLEDGRLKVWCVPGTVNPAYAGAVSGGTAAGGLVGGTISAGAAAGILAGVVIIAAVAGDDSSTTTTTTGSGS
ncbi:hypothetical protein KBY27_21720 [Ruegeria pomeroyi]|uniref:Uncharacterized protein n=1 Tax=Ruegeria pomeroyi TaxID=89184 RepID=A0A9Q3ZPE6_9RHOB|nr:hypothetical protein [Ruegeria pomeroyi]MCE8540090.1 hypothetical protein [Ruegeria pomeroyi]